MDGIHPFADFQTARLALFPWSLMMHPEPAIAAAKRGCDLALVCTDRLTKEKKLLAGARTIENLAIAVCSNTGAGIWRTPEGHQRWGEETVGQGSVCQITIDTCRTREKRFQDSVDFNVLLHP